MYSTAPPGSSSVAFKGLSRVTPASKWLFAGRPILAGRYSRAGIGIEGALSPRPPPGPSADQPARHVRWDDQVATVHRGTDLHQSSSAWTMAAVVTIGEFDARLRWSGSGCQPRMSS